MTIATYIRDQAYARLIKVGSWKTTRKTPIPTLQSDQLPALGAYIIRENLTPEGDANVGPPRYIADVTISFMVMDLASKPEVLEGSVDTAVDLIQDTLLKDGTFVNLRTVEGDPILDSIPNIARTYSFPNNSDTYYLECRLAMTFRYFCFFDPLAPNLLRHFSVDVRPYNDPVPGPDGPYVIELPGISEPELPPDFADAVAYVTHSEGGGGEVQLTVGDGGIGSIYGFQSGDTVLVAGVGSDADGTWPITTVKIPVGFHGTDEGRINLVGSFSTIDHGAGGTVTLISKRPPS